MAQTRSDNTKAALIRAAFRLFAQKGYSAASTREIATAANTNVASIPYHFGSKAGLRMACAQTIVERMSQLRNQPEMIDLPDIVQSAQTPFEAVVMRQANILLNLEESELMIGFMFREAHEKGEVFEHIYQNFFGPMFTLLHQMFLDAIGQDPAVVEEDRTRLIVFSIVGQMAYFRIGQPAVLKHMGWEDYHEQQTLEILSVLQSNIRAIVKTYRSVT